MDRARHVTGKVRAAAAIVGLSTLAAVAALIWAPVVAVIAGARWLALILAGGAA